MNIGNLKTWDSNDRFDTIPLASVNGSIGVYFLHCFLHKLRKSQILGAGQNLVIHWMTHAVKRHFQALSPAIQIEPTRSGSSRVLGVALRIITGMHRSGTSLIARLFYEAGADMGDPATFYRPDRWNPEGYYEQPDIHAVNMPLINGPWWKLAYYRLPSTETILRRAEKRADQIRSTARAYQGKVVKETRFCLTLPAWLKYGAEVDKILICLRDPVQVARSIQKRNRTTLRHGYYMWRLHNERILRHADEVIPIWVVDYNRVLKEDVYLQEVGAMFRFFDFDLTDNDLMDLRIKAVRTDMNHNLEQVAEYPPEIQGLWNQLRQRHGDQFA